MNVKYLLDRLPGGRAKSAGEPKPDLSSDLPREKFYEWAATIDSAAQVIEVGTKQSVAGDVTHFHDAFPMVPREHYLMVDVEDGGDVDIVADLHHLPADWTGRFDALVAVAVFEHLERPWIAAQEVARVLKPGGRCFIATHQTFPLHGYPSDFFRFSKEALTLIFADAGISAVEVAYEHRTRIITPRAVMSPGYGRGWNKVWPSYLCVNLFGEKPTAA